MRLIQCEVCRGLVPEDGSEGRAVLAVTAPALSSSRPAPPGMPAPVAEMFGLQPRREQHHDICWSCAAGLLAIVTQARG